MEGSSHRIRRQRWVVRAGSVADAFELRRTLREDWETRLLPAFDKVFADTGSGDDVIHIPRIELRLQVSPKGKLTELLPELVQRELSKELDQILQQQPRITESPGSPALWKNSPADRNRFESLLHYLQTGSATWPKAGDAAAVEIAVELREALREHWPEIRELAQRDRPPMAFCFRLLQLIPRDEAMGHLHSLLENVPHTWKLPVLEMLAFSFESSGLNRQVELEMAAATLAFSLDHANTSDIPDFTPSLSLAFARETPGAAAQFVASLPVSARTLFATDPIRGQHADVIHVEPAEGQGIGRDPRSELSVARTDWESGTASRDVPSHAPESDSRFSTLVSHAGLVLLHPFLRRFFESTGLKVHDNVELSPFGLARAAALLHFLATGREEIYEYDLALIKVLLGLNPDTPLCVSEGLIKDTDKSETEVLLQSVITHWGALKSTSLAGFQRTFLDRQALLREEEGGWRLQLERQPFDVLLEHLPWSISVVKLPWLKRPIYTEW
jgi:hypothetical protein